MNSGSPANKSRARHRPSKSSSAVVAFNYPSPKAHQAVSVSHILQNPHQPPRQIARSHSGQYAYQSYGTVTPPQTPPKTYQSSGNAGFPSTKKNKKNKPRYKPKDVDTTNMFQQGNLANSPLDDLYASPPSPLHGVNTPMKAYAGPNFHSSPAASSLPVPSFFSKSAPTTSTTSKSLQAMMVQDELLSGLSSSSPSPEASESESPLEKLFRADKEEKARKNRKSMETPPTSPEPVSAGITNSRIAEARPKFDESSKRHSFEASVFTMDFDKKESAFASYPTIDSADNSGSTDDWKSKSELLKSFLDQVKPTALGAPLSNLPALIAPQVSHQPYQYSSPVSISYGPPTKEQAIHPSSPHYSSFTKPQREARFIFTPPYGAAKPVNYAPAPAAAIDQIPHPPRRYCNPLFPSTETDSIRKDKDVKPRDVKEMEEYLRRVLKLDLHSSFSALAATS